MFSIFLYTFITMKLEVINLDKIKKGTEKSVKEKSRKLAKLFKKNLLIEVYLISAKRMKSLNSKFRKKDKSTNVLSFQKPKNFPPSPLKERFSYAKNSSSHSLSGEGSVGEVYLDPIYIEKHKEDLDLMLVHGVLHILGYDHERKSDRIKMERKEKALLSLISIS